MTTFVALLESDLVPVNQKLETKSTEEILEWAFDTFPNIAFLTSGQSAGSILAKIISQCGKKVDLVFADTGVLFDETHETIEKISQTYQFPLKRCTPALSMREQVAKYGALYLTHAGQEQCCNMRKVDPLLGIHKEYTALLGPLRRGEGGSRSRVPILSLDPTMKVIRINPMANLPEAIYQSHLDAPDTIINPLHFEGFPTIGCNRCTTPVREDEPKRAGRWRHLSGVDYCGINPTDFSKKSVSIEVPETVLNNLKRFPIS